MRPAKNPNGSLDLAYEELAAFTGSAARIADVACLSQ